MRCAIVVFAVTLGGAAAAEDSRVLSDPWYVTVGGYFAELSTDAAVGTGTVVGTVVRAEDQLGLDDQQSTFRLVAERRFGQRHAVGFEYFKIGRSGETELSDSIEFEGNLYEIGASLRSEFDTELYQLTYKYSFVNDGRTEAGIQAGLSTWSLSASLEGEATVDDGMGNLTTEFARAGEDVIVPIPSVGLFVRHAFGERAVFNASARFLRATIGDVEGRVVDTSVGLDYFFTRHFGVGLGVNGTDLRYDDSGENPVLFEYRQSGAFVHVGMVF